MSPATVECERCRDEDLHNHGDHRTKETFQSIYDSVKSFAENKPRDHGRDVQTCPTELRGAMRELLTKHVGEPPYSAYHKFMSYQSGFLF